MIRESERNATGSMKWSHIGNPHEGYAVHGYYPRRATLFHGIRPSARAPTDRLVAVGSRSDKKPHRSGSTGRKTFVSQPAPMSRSRGNWSRMERLLVAARPGRPSGRPGHPTRWLLSKQLHHPQQTDALGSKAGLTSQHGAHDTPA